MTWPSHVHHRLAQSWFAGRGSEPWATTLLTELGFLRLSCNPKVVGRPVLFAEAARLLRRIRLLPGHIFLDDTSTLLEPVVDLDRLVTSRQVTDLHLVNLSATAGAVLVTLDRTIPSYLAPADRRHVHVIDETSVR